MNDVHSRDIQLASFSDDFSVAAAIQTNLFNMFINSPVQNAALIVHSDSIHVIFEHMSCIASFHLILPNCHILNE